MAVAVRRKKQNSELERGCRRGLQQMGEGWEVAALVQRCSGCRGPSPQETGKSVSVRPVAGADP